MPRRGVEIAAAISAAIAIAALGLLTYENRFSSDGPSRTLLWWSFGVRFVVAISAWRGWVGVLLPASAVAFVPLGFYLLLTPSPYALVGLGDLVCMLLAGVLLLLRFVERQDRQRRQGRGAG